MTPAVIAVVLLVLFVGLRVAADEADARSNAADAEVRPARPWWREFTPVLSFLVLLPVVLMVGTGGILLLAGEGPLWWWLWLAGALVYGVILIARSPSE